MGSSHAQDIIDQLDRANDGNVRRSICESAVEEFVRQARLGPAPDLLPILGAIDALSHSSIWKEFMPITGPRLCRILSRPAILALDPNRLSLPNLRSKLIAWQDDRVFSRNHIQNALKVLDGLEPIAQQSMQRKAKEFCFEQARSEQKRRRINSALRPRNEPGDAEFVEIWRRVCEWDGRIPEHSAVDFGVGIDVYRYEVPPEPVAQLNHIVYVWDLDETLILFNCFVDTTRFQDRFHWLSEASPSVGRFLTDLVFDVADSHFFFKGIERFEQSHINDLISADDFADLDKYDFSQDAVEDEDGNPNWRLMSYRYREIQSRYRQPMTAYISSSTSERLTSCLKSVDRMSGGWLGAAQTLLELAWTSSASSSVIVSSGQLTPTLVKLLVYGLSAYFPIDHVYSASASSKAAIFESILHRYGKHCIYQVVGDSQEEEQACSVFSGAGVDVNFTKICSASDLRLLVTNINK